MTTGSPLYVNMTAVLLQFMQHECYDYEAVKYLLIRMLPVSKCLHAG